MKQPNSTKGRPAPTAPAPQRIPLEGFLTRNGRTAAIVLTILTVVLGALMFDNRLSFATDDSTYIKNAWDLLNLQQYPTFQGPMYPLMLMILLAVGGFSVGLFKAAGLVFLALQTWLINKSLWGKVTGFEWLGGCIVAALNFHVLQYGSFTFNEAFFMGLQALLLWAVSRIDDLGSLMINLREHWLRWLGLGLALLLVALTKNAAIVAVVVVPLYFLIQRQPKAALLAFGAFVAVRVPFELLARATTNRPEGTEQLETLLRKNHANPAEGYEDIGGFFDRFTENLNNYASIHFYKILGLRGNGEPPSILAQNQTEASGFLTLVFVALALGGLLLSLRRNAMMLYIALYCGGMMALTFVVLQTYWNQERLMLIYVPLLVPLFLWTLWELGQHYGWRWMGGLTIAFLALITLTQLGGTFRAITEARKPSNRGYTPEQNDFIAMCEAASRTIPDSLRAGTNKPAEAFVFAKKPLFSGLYEVNVRASADTLQQALKSKKIHYLIVDGLGNRAGQIANTLGAERPDAFEQIAQTQMGQYPAYLLQINFDAFSGPMQNGAPKDTTLQSRQQIQP